MTENTDSQADNLCLTEDAFDQFQAVSMYQEKEYIILSAVESAKPKEPDPGDKSHFSYDNEVVVSTENEVNSTVNDNTEENEEMQSEMEQKSFDDSAYLKTTTTLDNLDQNYEPRKVTRRGRKKKHVTQNDTNISSNNVTILGSKESNDIQVNTEQDSSLISSTVPRRRGRKPKPKPVPSEPITPSEINQDSLNISSSRLSSDLETSDIVASVKRRRGRPRKSFADDMNYSKPIDKDLSSELSGSDSNRIDGVLSTRKRGRPRKSKPVVDPQGEVPNNTDALSNDLISLEDLNGAQATHKSSKELVELDISKIESRDLDKKIFSDSDNDEFDDVTLSNLKSNPETSTSADRNILSENNKDLDIKNSTSEYCNEYAPPNKKRNTRKKGRGKPKKDHTLIAEKNNVESIDKSESVAASSVSQNETQLESSHLDSDDNEELSLSQLKEINSNSANTENNNTTVVSTTENEDVIVDPVESSSDIIKTPTKRNSKMPVMSDFEYNVDSVIEKEETENGETAENSLLVEDTSKRPIRRKVAKLQYQEESDEDPFANVELSDDDEPRRKGKKYYSDDEYIPGRRGNKDIDSTDSEISVGGVVDDLLPKRKKLRKKSENQSPQKKLKGVLPVCQDVDSDDIEVCLQPSTVAKPIDGTDSENSKLWGCSNEFENFLAKKIQGTNLQIKKVSATAPTENKALEIPVLDPEAKKTFEMCSQTSIIHTTSTGVQTTTPYDIPMKEKLPLTAEQSEKACYFLNSIVKTTSELGTLMTQKSEDFIKKKINTTHVTDTMKMDYCVKKSFLLFKLAKHNLMQMEEDLAKQYEEFLESNNLTACRELPKQIISSAKPASSDSDCEIVEEPINTPVNKSKQKPKFNPKTVFLNKELSIKIAKKPSDITQKLDIKGRTYAGHTVWINDTVMVKKVNKPTQSFLAQDSRNKKPPDNKITTKMVSDFFKNYYHQKAISLCAPFTTTDWLNVNRECVCNYFVVQPVFYNNNNSDVNYSANGGISTENHASTSETNHTIKQIANKTVVTCPETLLKLCFRIVKNHIHDKRRVKEVCHQNIQNELTDGKHQPITLFRQSLRVLTGTAVTTMERSPTPRVNITPKDESTVPLLKVLCHKRIVALFSNSGEKDYREELEVEETRCSTSESNYSISTYSSKCSSSSLKIKEIKSLLSLCVEFIQRKQVIESSNTIHILTPKSLKTSAFEHIKHLMYGDTHIPLFETSEFNLEQHNDEMMIQGLTINSINTLSEEAFLNLDHSHADNPDSPDYLDGFDNDDHYEPDYNETLDENPIETEEENHIEPENSWVSQVQMEEPRSCYNTTNTDANGGEVVSVTQIKIEPEDDLPDHLDALAHVKIEPIHGADEMTVIPEVKPEAIDVLGSATPELNKQISGSYDVDTFEQFATTNKIMREMLGGDIYTQSMQKIRRQHEPDYEEDDMSMSLLVPQTYEPLTIETAKGSLMESSSSGDETSKNKRTIGKKKPDKRKGKQKKVDPKTVNKETPTLTKDKPTNEVANLTKRMRDRIRQEEKKDDSSDSEPENLPLRLRSRKEQEKSKQAQTSKAKESEIQCNNVDSTDQVDDNMGNFTGFSAIDQNEITNYQKYMQFVYDKIIPEKENEIAKTKEKEVHEEPLISNEPVELLECQPTMPIFDDPVNTKRSTRKGKLKEEMSKKEEKSKKEEISKKADISKKSELSKKEEMPIQEEIYKKGISVKKEVDLKEKVSEETPSFVERHGWHCYPVNGEDEKLYQSTCIALEKLPESFVQTYFEYQGITRKDDDDQEIARLTNLNSLNRTVQLNLPKNKVKLKRDAKEGDTSEMGSRAESPTYSDHGHYAELEPSDDEGANIDDEVAPPVPLKQTENTLAKNLLMKDNDSDSDSNIKKEPSDGTEMTLKKEPTDGTEAKQKFSSKTKKKGAPVVEDSSELMLTADKMMNKELTLLHAPVLVNDVQETPSKGPVTRNKQKSATKNQPSTSKMKNEEDSSSEEEKQWVSTKEKLLKRMGKKDQTSLDDAKRAKLVSEFIERRGDQPDSHIRPRSTRTRRSGKRFLERQKQLGILSRELFGESSDTCNLSKRSQASLFRGRRNIRKVIDKKSLARSTVVANMEEFERKKRLNNRQAKLRELLGCEEGVNVLVINDEVCLEYDFEENRPVVTVHPFFTKVMKAHQYEGVKFMWDACFESLAEIEAGRPGGGCILAHCMGLGKTLQVLALLHTVLTHPGVRMQRVLVCCPLSTVLNWVDEIHKWIGPVTNEIKVFELSKLKKTYERAYQLEDWYNGGGIFIIGYELFRSLSTLDPFLDDVRPTIVNKIRTALLDPGPDIIVCDEGHLLKNDCSVLAVAMSRVVTKRRIILTGTPMQNNLREYYCMVNFVKPNLLGTYAEYSNRFENPIMNGQHRDSSEEDIKLMKARTHILHKVLEGCLQRQEASVLYPYLPKKHEYTVFITLTPCQWDLYKHYLHNYGKQTKQSILKDFHILQKIWSHPQVLHNFQTKARDRDEKSKIKAEKLEDDLATEDLEEIKPNAAEDLWWLQYLDGGNMLETLDSSNKFVVVFRILDECIALGDKVLIFSTSLFCLDALEYFLKKIKKWSLGHEYFRLDGSVPVEVRQKWCREFNADNNYKTKLFLVSTRAGCLGLNMTSANRVIIMDTSWNPAHDIQSIFRVYRFGQKKDCYIYRLVAMGTMEQKIYERSVTKQAVACRVVDEQQIDRHYNMAELTELYKFDEGGSCVAGGVAVGVHDVALLRVARDVLLHAVHEHDSLLRGSSEQGLPEHERNAAWMQFQQEQANKQMENKLAVKIPKIPLKRVREQENGQAAASATVVKEEDPSEDYNPNESKTKKGKKNSIIKCCIPIQDNKSETRSNLKKEPAASRPGTSKQNRDSVASTSSDQRRLAADINQEEIMVEKITDILLKYNFQNKKGKPDIAKLVKKVRSMVSKGYVTEEDNADDLTASIAKVLLPQQMSLPMVTNIMCESINNSAEPGAMPSDADPELITSDPTPRYYTEQSNSEEPETRTKRKAAIAAEKCIDSLAQEVVINIDDDDFDARDTDFVPDDDDDVAFKPKKKSKNLTPSKFQDEEDERTMSADESEKMNHFDSLKTIIPTEDTDTDTVKRKPGPKRSKDRIFKQYTRKEPSEPVKKPEPYVPTLPERVCTPPGIDYSSIILSDDEEPLTRKTNEKLADTSKKSPANPVPEPLSDEVVPLPMSLLKNQNFINIVAHTYLVGNPMLDEDAATLAAQYSTLKAFKEAEQTGKDVISGPIYDIAVKVIGKDILKKMNSANPKAAASSTDDAVASIQMKEQMIQTQKTFEETAKSSKAKSAKLKLREDMIEQKLAMNRAKAEKLKAAELEAAAAVAPPAVSASSNVVPVGFIKTITTIGSASPALYRALPPLKTERVEPRVECILPDDDDVIISDVRAAPAPAPTAAPPDPPPTTKPIVLNNFLYKPQARGFEAQQNFRVTVGSTNKPPISTPKLTTPPKIIVKPYMAGQLTKINLSNITPAIVQPTIPTPVVAERILPNDNTICLDSDEEEAPPPAAPPAVPQAPVPVSLVSAQNPGVKLPLPPMQNLLHHTAPATSTQQTTPQRLVLRQVVTPNGTQPQYVLIASDKIPMPTLNSAAEPPKTIQTAPQIVPSTTNTFNTAPGESILAAKKPEISRTACKPGDILRISKTGAIEVINRADVHAIPAKPTSDPIETSNIQNPKPVDSKPCEDKFKKIAIPRLKPAVDPKTSQEKNKKVVISKLRPILPKPPNYDSLDLTDTSPVVSKSKTYGPKSVKSSTTTVDLTDAPAVAAKSKPVPSKPTTSASVDLTDTSEVTLPKKDYNRSAQKTDARKSRVISSSSSSSDSRATSPENPLSILKDVVQIKAVDYPEKSVTLQKTKSKNANISVQHIISSDTERSPSEPKKPLKLTKVPRDQVPKHIDEAVEKQIRKEALMKKITPLLSKNQPPKEELKKIGKNTISFDNLSSAHTSKLMKNTGAGKSTDTKVKSGLKAETVDLTNIFPAGTTIKAKPESKKRQAPSTEVPAVKKKKPAAPMTLKDFNLDDIDDIIELD
ncbi:hypothetical protein PYW07_005666 [Mythimna separata]|uniref:Uncharacterized protein n=1 Tax=Mythimna separata TaxID=271217 RepID=A0AAD8DRH8_MYTSE|nr:hypothetical protein PYW07_005666 [Mythimna separata]